MSSSFQAKLIAIVATNALAFLVLIAASAVITRRAEQQLTDIQEQAVPRVDLGPRLEARFEKIRRALQDAVAGHDAEALVATRELKVQLLAKLVEAQAAVDPSMATLLRAAIEDYYASALDVSHRLIAGETGVALVAAMATMQTKQAKAVDLLNRATKFDRAQLKAAFAAASHTQLVASQVRAMVSVACLTLVLLLSLWITRGVVRSLAELNLGLKRFGQENFDQPVRIVSRDEIADVAHQANSMADNLQRLRKERQRSDWLRNGLVSLSKDLRGELESKEVGERSIGFLARYLSAPAAALYITANSGRHELIAQYAVSDAPTSFHPEEGLVGQAALQKEILIVSDPPSNYLRVRSGLGESSPTTIVLLPIVHTDRITGVIELAFFSAVTDAQKELLLSVQEAIGITLEVARARAATRALLAETQEQAQRLVTQEEALRASNEELQSQQEELRQTNEELSHQAEELDEQRRALESTNLEVSEARDRLEEKAQELVSVSFYKTQFLANMSHELRTPLNSMLLLSNLLAENQSGNLTDKQVEFSKTIYTAGKDLLKLINEVLDLAKVEAGKKEIRAARIPFQGIVDHVQSVFAPLAAEKGLELVVELAPELPATLHTDGARVDQVLNNLLGNAIRFTRRGKVLLHIGPAANDAHFRVPHLVAARTVAFAVTDTGIGIAAENLDRIFAPFEQVDGAPDRAHGGTGLGLTIAREIASLLGGELQVVSEVGKGSMFTLYLPLDRPAAIAAVEPSMATAAVTPGPSPLRNPITGRESNVLQTRVEPILLVIEDDRVMTDTFGELIAGQGLQCLIAHDGKTGIRLAAEHRPSGIILDIKLPDIDGWAVLNVLQANPETAQIPVHIVSALDAAARGMAMGAVGYLTKPATRGELLGVVQTLAPKSTTLRILVVEAGAEKGDSILEQLAGENLKVHHVASATAALQALKLERFTSIILDLSLPDMDGLRFLELLDQQYGAAMPSVIVYTARALSKEEAKRLEAYTEAVVLKEGPSAERLLEEVRLFVQRTRDGLGPRRLVAAVPLPHPVQMRLEGKKVLVVDDDMRTLYALSATLRAKGLDVLIADTGIAALEVLDAHPEMQAVLMDIMMPEMDGYEAIRRIRKNGQFDRLPIIVLTAKAMKGDREKSLEIGATDYLPKPVDADNLLAMLNKYLSTDATPSLENAVAAGNGAAPGPRSLDLA